MHIGDKDRRNTRHTNDMARQFFHRAFSIEKTEGVEDVQKTFPN
jgi:hypothetical protein